MSVDPTTETARRRSRFWRLVRIPLLVLLGLFAVLYALQGRLIFPGASTQGTADAQVSPPDGSTLLTLKAANGERVVALFGPALTPTGRPVPDAATRPTILFFYGNGMCLADSVPRFEEFRRLGANVMIPDYVGYGMSGGTAGEDGCYQAADASYDHLVARDDVDPKRIVIAGWSLGAAVAIDLASRRESAGLAIFSPFTSMTEMARLAMPMLPTSLLLRHRFDSLSKLDRIKIPVLIGHGRRDRIIPFSMSERLAERLNGPVRVDVDEADHNDFFEAGSPAVEDALRRFLERAGR